MARWYRSRLGWWCRSSLARHKKPISPLRRIAPPKFPSKILAVLLILVLSIYIFYLIDRNLRPTITSIAEARAHMIAAETINRVLYEKVLPDIDYNDLIIVHKDAQQRITLMQANTIKINRIVSQSVLEIKKVLKELQIDTIKVPLMQALGSQLLANHGPHINVRLLPVGTVNVKFDDQFEQAGINQVRHILYLGIETTVRIVIPLATKDISVVNQIPIAETIIVGQVPNTYLGAEHPLTGGLIWKNQTDGQ